MGVYRLYTYARTEGREESQLVPLDSTSRLLVDGNGALFEIADRVLQPSAKSGSTEPLYYMAKYSYEAYFAAAMSYLSPFMKAKVQLIFVFDNNIGASETWFKREEDDERKSDSLADLVQIQESLLGNRRLGKRYKDKQSPRLAMYASQLRTAIRQCGFEIRQSFNEADAEMAHMLLEEPSITAITAKDSDFYVFRGCRCISFEDIKIDSSGHMTGLMFTAEGMALSMGGLTHTQLVDTALILGCDYTKALNARADVAGCLQVNVLYPEAVAYWVKHKAPANGVMSYPPFKALLSSDKDLREAWEYSRSLYTLERRSRTPKDLVSSLPDLANADLTFLIAVGVEKGQVPCSYLKYMLQKYWNGGLDFEMVYPEDDGRPPVARMLQPLRKRLYGLLGIKEVTETIRRGTNFVLEVVEGADVPGDMETLKYYLEERQVIEPSSSLAVLECFIQQAYKVDGSGTCTDLSELAAKRPEMYLAALALRVVAYSNWAYMCKAQGDKAAFDEDYRLTELEFETLAATIAACQDGGGNVSPDSFFTTYLRGHMVMEAASIASWFTSAYAFVKDLLSLFRGPAACIQVEPRNLYDPFTYHALRMGYMRADETVNILCRIALEPLWAMGFQNDVLFRQESQTEEAIDELASPLGQTIIGDGTRMMKLGQGDEEDDEDICQSRMDDFTKDDDDEPPVQKFIPPTDLPIRKYREHIVRTIRENLVTMIEGETGCGKSTQVPQYLVKDDKYAKVIVTQPTRLAATAAAKRVAHEMGCELGKEVGYRIGGEGESSRITRITFATAGWLLALLARPGVKESEPQFSHIIIDEVHGRSLDSDLLCLVTKLLLLQSWTGGEFRIVLMSATLQGAIFEEYFGRELGQAVPRLQVGVTRHSVAEVFLEDFKTTWPMLFKGKLNMCMPLDSMLRKFSKVGGSNDGRPINVRPAINSQSLALAVHLIRHICRPGETALVFVAGMADIDQLFDLLKTDGESSKLEILVCHSQISLEDQSKALEPNKETARVILATNMAESSITFPLVTYVIDFGVCKRIEYDQKEHRTILQACWISKASMKQRSGRTGRVCPGTAIRLYTRNLAEAAEPYDPPEMLTQPLEQVVLRLKVMNFSNVRDTLAQCVQPPELGQVENAINGLFRIGALESADELSQVTSMGHIMSSLGLNLQVARMVVLGVALDCPIEAIVLGAAITVQDPFMMPHAAVTDDVKDYLALVKRVQTSRDKHSHGLGSDPFTILFLYIKWLRLAPEARSSFAKRNGLVFARMRNLDSCVRTIALHLSRNSRVVPTYTELIINLRKPMFESRVLDPDRLFLLRALLAGAFYENTLQGKSKLKEYTEVASRTLKIGELPVVLSDPALLEEALCMGPLESVSKFKGGGVEVVFPCQYQVEGDEPPSVMYADEEPLGRHTDVCSSIKALYYAIFKGDLIVCKPKVIPGMHGYIPPGAPGFDMQETENLREDGRCAIRNMVSPAGKISIRSMKSDLGIQISKQSVLKSAAIPRRANKAPLYFTTPEIQKIVTKDGWVTFIATKCSLLPFSESVITMLVAAFATDEPVIFMKNSGCYSDDDLDSDDLNHDIELNDVDTYRCMSVGTWLSGSVALPGQTPQIINRFRSLISQCIGKKRQGGLLKSSPEAAQLILRLRNLVDQSAKQPTPSRSKFGYVEEVYEVSGASISAALPQLRLRGDDDDDDEEDNEDEEEEEDPYHRSQARTYNRSSGLDYNSLRMSRNPLALEDVKLEKKKVAPLKVNLNGDGARRHEEEAPISVPLQKKEKKKRQKQLPKNNLFLVDIMVGVVRKAGAAGYKLDDLRCLALSKKKRTTIYKGSDLEQVLLGRGLYIDGGLVYKHPPETDVVYMKEPSGAKPMKKGGGSTEAAGGGGGPFDGLMANKLSEKQHVAQSARSSAQNNLIAMMVGKVRKTRGAGYPLADLIHLPLSKKKGCPTYEGDDLEQALVEKGLYIDGSLVYKQPPEAKAMKKGGGSTEAAGGGGGPFDGLMTNKLSEKQHVAQGGHTQSSLIAKMVELVRKTRGAGYPLADLIHLPLSKKKGGPTYEGDDLEQALVEKGLYIDGGLVYKQPPETTAMKKGGGSPAAAAGDGGGQFDGSMVSGLPSQQHLAQSARSPAQNNLIDMMVGKVRKVSSAGYPLAQLRRLPLSKKDGGPTYEGDDLEQALLERGLCINDRGFVFKTPPKKNKAGKKSRGSHEAAGGGGGGGGVGTAASMAIGLSVEQQQPGTPPTSRRRRMRT